jgi:hypothetical protein
MDPDIHHFENVSSLSPSAAEESQISPRARPHNVGGAVATDAAHAREEAAQEAAPDARLPVRQCKDLTQRAERGKTTHSFTRPSLSPWPGRAWLLWWWSLSAFGQCVALPIRMLRFGTAQFTTPINNGGPLAKFYIWSHLAGFFSVLVIAPRLLCGATDTAMIFILYSLTAGILFGCFTQASHLNLECVQASYKVGAAMLVVVHTEGGVASEPVLPPFPCSRWAGRRGRWRRRRTMASTRGSGSSCRGTPTSRYGESIPSLMVPALHKPCRGMLFVVSTLPCRELSPYRRGLGLGQSLFSA